MATIVETILRTLEEFNGQRSVKQKARATAELKIIADAADRIAEQYKPALIKAQVYELFPEYGLKVEYAAPKSSSYIDAAKLAKQLIRDGRTDDLLKIISITEKSLDDLEDGEALAEKYRKTGEETKENVKVGKMTKAELKESVSVEK